MSGQDASPTWGGTTKAMVALVTVALIAALLVRFQSIVPLLVTAGILAYVFLPLIRLLHHRARIPRGLAVNLTFLILLLSLLAGSAAAGFAVVQQLQSLFSTLQQFLSGLPDQLGALSQQTIALGPWHIDLSQFDFQLLAEQALAVVQPVLGQASLAMGSVAVSAIGSVGKLIFVLAVAYYLSLDLPRLRSAWEQIRLPGHEEDLRRLGRALVNIWNRFLRGQLVLAMIGAVLAWVLLSILEVRFALGLGVLTGLAKFLPIIGPVSVGAMAALVAFFQPAHWLGLAPLAHSVVIVVGVTIVDQSIDYLIQPRIMGISLNLHPVLILVGAIVGASLAGIIGLLLSAPATATLVLLGRYIYRKLLDLPPWDPPIDAFPPPKVRWRLFSRSKRRKTEQAES